MLRGAQKAEPVGRWGVLILCSEERYGGGGRAGVGDGYMPMKRFLIIILAGMAALGASAGWAQGGAGPYVAPMMTPVAATPLDNLVRAQLSAHRLTPAPLCSDEVFLRRVFLDLLGTPPSPEEARDFLADRKADKRARLIDALLTRDEFADYWSLKWGDLLRVKSEFPIRLWPNAVQAYHHWIHDAMQVNLPYDQFARALLTSSGSNFHEPPVNFYRAVQDHDPQTLAAAVALTFMGTRLASWPEDKRKQMAAFFSRILYKGTDEWKEEIVELDPAPAQPLAATLPDGSLVLIAADQDPREVFADWLLKPGNPWLARAIVNRMWYWFMGRGIIQEPDDIRPDNPPSNPALLAYLEKELVDSHYDLRHIYRLILNSRTYQQSSLAPGESPDQEKYFAFYPVRRLDAEVLIDALGYLGGEGEGYQSIIPEPYTYIPPTNRTIDLADGSISSHFLELFGRPARDTGMESERNNQPTADQELFLLNGSEVEKKIERSPALKTIVKLARGDTTYLTTWTYMTILSRYPTQQEMAAAQGYFRTKGLGVTQADWDLAWALVNSKEFLYRH